MAPPLTAPTTASSRLRRGLGDRAVAHLFIWPTVALLVAMNVFPLFWSLYLSFCKYEATSMAPPAWYGGAGYGRLLHDPAIWHEFTATAEFTLLSVTLELLVGFGMAMLLNRKFGARGIITTLILLPMMLSPVVVGLFWRFMFDSNWGLVNWLLGALHLASTASPINWLNTPSSAMWALVIVDTWMWSPFVMLISLAGLNAVPPHLYEAADVDRASAWFKFRYITVPTVAPLVAIALLFRTIDCFKIFDVVYVLTGGGPGEATRTVSYSLYKLAFDTHETGYACALGYVILLVIIGLANLYIIYLARLRGEAVPESAGLIGGLVARIRRYPAVRWALDHPTAVLGTLIGVAAILRFGQVIAAAVAWREGIVAVAVLVAVIWLAQYVPQRVRHAAALAGVAVAAVVYLLPIYWITATSLKPSTQLFSNPPRLIPTHIARLAEPVPSGFAFGVTLANYDALILQRENNDPRGRVTGLSDFPGQLANSVLIGLISTLMAVALGTIAAYAFARFRIKGKNDLLFFILSTRMMPAIVVVIPIFLMFRSLGLLDTRLGLIILYTAFNLSFSAYLLKGFFDDIPHEYDDAALLDGWSRLQAFRRISLPQAFTGIAATAVFCFITAWNEFAFAQILSVTQPLTAPPSIVSRTGSGGTEWGQIAAGAVLFLIPAAAFTFSMRGHLLRGVTFGAIKR